MAEGARDHLDTKAEAVVTHNAGIVNVCEKVGSVGEQHLSWSEAEACEMESNAVTHNAKQLSEGERFDVRPQTVACDAESIEECEKGEPNPQHDFGDLSFEQSAASAATSEGHDGSCVINAGETNGGGDDCVEQAWQCFIQTLEELGAPKSFVEGARHEKTEVGAAAALQTYEASELDAAASLVRKVVG